MGPIHRGRVRRGPPMHSPVEGMWSRQHRLLPHQEVSSDQKSGVPVGETVGLWKVTYNWNDEDSWLLEGRTVLIFKGGDRKDPTNYRPITCLPTITKMVTLAIHRRMRGWLFGSLEENILEYEQRGVRTSQG